MNDSLSETAIVCAVAEDAALCITRKVINELQRMKYTLSGDDSELKTTWDEICAQIQYEKSIFWNVYDDTVRGCLAGYVEELPAHEREALWLQTEEGIDWAFEESEDREPYPVYDNDIIEYLAREYIYTKAEEWTNARIRAFLERARMRD